MGQRKPAIAYIRYWSNTSQPASKIHTPRTLQAMASLSLTVAPKSSKTWVLLSPYEVVLSPAGYRASRDHSAGPWLKENGSLAALGRSRPGHGYTFPERSIYKVCKNMEGGSPRPHPRGWSQPQATPPRGRSQPQATCFRGTDGYDLLASSPMKPGCLRASPCCHSSLWRESPTPVGGQEPSGSHL